MNNVQWRIFHLRLGFSHFFSSKVFFLAKIWMDEGHLQILVQIDTSKSLFSQFNFFFSAENAPYSKIVPLRAVWVDKGWFCKKRICSQELIAHFGKRPSSSRCSWCLDFIENTRAQFLWSLSLGCDIRCFSNSCLLFNCKVGTDFSHVTLGNIFIMWTWEWVHFFSFTRLLYKEPLLVAELWPCSQTSSLLTVLTSGDSLLPLPLESPHHSCWTSGAACLPRGPPIIWSLFLFIPCSTW